jgi:hypothetical protein
MLDDVIDEKILEYCRHADIVELSNKTSLKPNKVMDFVDMIKNDKEFRKLLSVLFPFNFE